MISLEVSLSHRFPEFHLEVEFTASAGVTALFGRSGSGKTTIGNAIAGLLTPERGRVVVGGEVLFDTALGICLPPHQRQVGYVFQESRLFPHLTVRQNLLFGRWFSRKSSQLISLEQVLRMLDIAPLLERRPHGLSGGEKQRVAIGRALLSNPRLLLLDEPLAALDGFRKAEILPYLERIRDEAGLPILYVSHSVAEVARLANTVVLLQSGRVLRSGETEDILADPEAVPLIGVREAGAVLPVRVEAHHPDGLSELRADAEVLWIPQCTAPVGTRLRLRIHAQDILISLKRPEGMSALNVLPVTVDALHEGHGPGVAVRLTSGPHRLLARITRRSAQALKLEPGTSCFAILKSVAVAQDDVGVSPH